MKNIIRISNSYTEALAIGVAFIRESNIMLSTKQIVNYFSQANTPKQVCELANTLNGEWFYISPLLSDGERFIVVDHFASRAVYYRVINNELLISDNGFELLQKNEPIRTDYNTVLYFSQHGFTPKEETLHSEIKRMQPGTIVHYTPTPNYITLYQYTYFPYDSAPISVINNTQAKQTYKRLLSNAMERMLQIIGKRPIVLPLTGGLDSRLIACFLKKMGKPPVTTLTYGINEHTEEVIKAQKIAYKLGFKHQFVGSIPKGFDKELGYTQNKEILAYLEYISGLSSGYYFAEYTSAKEIAQMFPQAVVLPGHNGGAHAGKWSNMLTQLYHWNKNLLPHFMAVYYGSGRKLNKRDYKRLIAIHKNELMEHNLDQLGLYAFARYHIYNWETKYYINSARSWQYFNNNVSMPYLDRELCEFTFRLPFNLLKGTNLYEQIAYEIFEELGVLFPDDTSRLNQLKTPHSRLKNIIRPYVSYQLNNRNRPLFSGDKGIGFETIMGGTLLKETLSTVPFVPTSINGLSFAWWLHYLGIIK